MKKNNKKVNLITPEVYGDSPINKFHYGDTKTEMKYSGRNNVITNDFYGNSPIYNLQNSNFSGGVFAGENSDVYIGGNLNGGGKTNTDSSNADQINTKDFNGNIAVFNNGAKEELVSQKNINGNYVTTTRRYVGTNEKGEKLYEVTTYTYNPKNKSNEASSEGKPKEENTNSANNESEVKEENINSENASTNNNTSNGEKVEDGIVVLPTPTLPTFKPKKSRLKKSKNKQNPMEMA